MYGIARDFSVRARASAASAASAASVGERRHRGRGKICGEGKNIVRAREETISLAWETESAEIKARGTPARTALTMCCRSLARTMLCGVCAPSYTQRL